MSCSNIASTITHSSSEFAAISVNYSEIKEAVRSAALFGRERKKNARRSSEEKCVTLRLVPTGSNERAALARCMAAADDSCTSSCEMHCPSSEENVRVK
ncbi:hypothetical protein AVEN_218579-1 [Araneus ventricosus]|uniref:Uncharacterized protein n=1 Tax=Araneus ventricosus TaxID=182803 RepID=A0A4Y2IZE6_ARAVE|nr:hypothetical protein AVEN_218579-1 [Araneus ventricosus]